MKNEEKNNISLRWMVAILVLVSIFIIAFRAKSDAEVINFVSFAATLSSIILSIIAIVYTFITSNSGSTINENLINISDKLLKQTEELNAVYQKVTTITCAIPEKLDQINSTFSETTKLFINNKSETKKPDRGIKVNIENIINNSPLFIFVLYYSLNLISKNKTAIDINKIGDTFNKIWKKDDNTAYTNGFFKGLRSIGVIYFEDNDKVFYNFDIFDNDFSMFTKDRIINKALEYYSNITSENEKLVRDTFNEILNTIDTICIK